MNQCQLFRFRLNLLNVRLRQAGLPKPHFNTGVNCRLDPAEPAKGYNLLSENTICNYFRLLSHTGKCDRADQQLEIW